MTLRWGILSSARIGVQKVIPGIMKADRCSVIAIASRDAGRARALAERFGIAKAYGAYEDLLKDPDVDAVYVPLPNHLHAEWTTAAAEAGKHVLCEKPIAMNAVEAQAMLEACSSSGVRLMEAFMYRLHTSWEAVRELVSSGRIGPLRAVQCWFSGFNDDPGDIRNVAEFGGGALIDVGCYAVNLSRMLFGTEPDRIEASVTRDPAMGVDVLTSAILGFGDGVATFTCSTRAAHDQRVHVYGTEQRVSVGIPLGIPSDVPTQVFVTTGGTSGADPSTNVMTFPPVDQYSVQAERFARAVLDHEPTPIPPEDAVANMRVIDAIFEIGEKDPRITGNSSARAPTSAGPAGFRGPRSTTR